MGRSCWCRAVLSLLLLRSLLLVELLSAVTAQHCPCEFPKNEASPGSRGAGGDRSSLTVCYKRPAEAYAAIVDTHINQIIRARETFKPIEDVKTAASAGCDLLLEISIHSREGAAPRMLCPQTCSPIPVVTMPIDIFHESLPASAFPIFLTCSMTLGATPSDNSLWSDWIRKLHLQQRFNTFPRYVLHEVIWRRYYECHETAALVRYSATTSRMKYDNNGTTDRDVQGSTLIHRNSSVFRRRKVKAIVVWVGWTGSLSTITHQHDMLKRESMLGSEAVLGWTATDSLYPCRPESIQCLGSNKKYNGHLTNSAVNFMPTGWGCAQRRPLRALAHLLLFFRPDYIILADDDTLVNYPRIKQILSESPELAQNLTRTPLYIGEAMGKLGDEGHLSKLGMFIGGSGYIIGSSLLDRLTNKEILSYEGFELFQSLEYSSWRNAVKASRQWQDLYRSWSQIYHLSVLREGANHAKRYCTSNYTCVKDHVHTNEEGLTVVKIGVRLIDFCANLMANEHTCQHSDHSMGRCFLYGAAAIPYSSYCRYQNAAPVISGMCFTAPKCNLSEQITCHRYQSLVVPITAGKGSSTVIGEEMTAVKLSKNKNHYRYYSSLLNGSVSDSFLA